MAKTSYTITNQETHMRGSLIDHGANGGLAGSDMLIVETKDNHSVDITGMGNSKLENLKIGTVASKVTTKTGDVILVFNNYAILGKGNTIHSEHQLLDFGNEVSSRSRKL